MNTKLRLLGVVLGVLCVSAVQAHAAVWFVDKDNTGPEDGTSWATAFNNIQEGMDAACAHNGLQQGTRCEYNGTDRNAED